MFTIPNITEMENEDEDEEELQKTNFYEIGNKNQNFYDIENENEKEKEKEKEKEIVEKGKEKEKEKEMEKEMEKENEIEKESVQQFDNFFLKDFEEDNLIKKKRRFNDVPGVTQIVIPQQHENNYQRINYSIKNKTPRNIKQILRPEINELNNDLFLKILNSIEKKSEETTKILNHLNKEIILLKNKN